MQIGDLAERTGLSLRTIRQYEEVGLLLVIKQMKPLDFSLEKMRELLEIRDRLANPRLAAKTHERRQRGMVAVTGGAPP